MVGGSGSVECSFEHAIQIVADTVSKTEVLEALPCDCGGGRRGESEVAVRKWLC